MTDHPFVILNKEGAGGSVGLREVKNADPDGYTIGVWHSGLVFGSAMGARHSWSSRAFLAASWLGPSRG